MKVREGKREKAKESKGKKERMGRQEEKIGRGEEGEWLEKEVRK